METNILQRVHELLMPRKKVKKNNYSENEKK
jgi:hypothetical protein